MAHDTFWSAHITRQCTAARLVLLQADLQAVRDVVPDASCRPSSSSAVGPLPQREATTSPEGSVASLGFGEAGRELSVVRTAPQKRAWLERHASLLRTCNGAQRVRLALRDCGARVSVALIVERRAERALQAVQYGHTSQEQQLSQISSLLAAATAVGAAELGGGASVPRITGGASATAPSSPPAVGWQASQSTTGSGVPASLLEGVEHVRQLLFEDMQDQVSSASCAPRVGDHAYRSVVRHPTTGYMQEEDVTPNKCAAGTPDEWALPTHGGVSLEYMLRDPTGVLARYGVIFDPRRLSAAVQVRTVWQWALAGALFSLCQDLIDTCLQARLTLRKQELEDRFLKAEEAQRLATYCGRTLGTALARLHTPSLGTASSSGSNAEHCDKFAAQQEQAAMVHECARHVGRQVPLVIGALANCIMLQVRARAHVTAVPGDEL